MPTGALTEIKRAWAPIMIGLAFALLFWQAPSVAARQAAVASGQPAERATLADFARAVGLNDIDGFVATVAAISGGGRLPARYVTKGEAERSGWRPGSDLCRHLPGRAIGGDRFGNREGRLPGAAGRRWTEADLDFNCGARGAKRLVFSNDGLIYVTVNHYQTFHAVPK